MLIPTTRPTALISGPPELPDDTAASVWINPFSGPASVDSVRSSEETMPRVTVGSPSRSNA